jgi:hypothetical protein
MMNEESKKAGRGWEAAEFAWLFLLPAFLFLHSIGIRRQGGVAWKRVVTSLQRVDRDWAVVTMPGA